MPDPNWTLTGHPEVSSEILMKRLADGSLVLIGDTAPLPVSFGDSASLDAFGRLRVSQPITIFDSQHQYNINALVWDTGLSSGTGAVTHLPNESAAHLSTGGTASGAKAVLQTKAYHRYQPGKSQLVLFTGTFGAAVANVRRRYGYFDAQNGLFFEQTASAFSVVVRSYASAAAVDSATPQASWNLDPMDGTGASGITLDVTKSQIFVIDLEWLSVGRVRFGFVFGGRIVYCHDVANINANTGPYMTTANLPIRAEIENTDTAAGANTFKQICASVISEGGQEDDRAYLFSAGNGITTKAVTTRRPIATIRPGLTYNGIANRGQVIPVEIDLQADSNALYEIVLNGTLTGASFASAGTHSIAEYDTAATAISGGTVVESGFISTAGGVSRGIGRNSLLGRLPLTLNAAGTSGDTLSVVVTSFTGTANTAAQLTWREFR